ncbi:hypothetical protein D7V90_15505 [bacterium 1xD42-87]|nr:hypothetical protein D7V90_15505 [bacterium 1xD42-87]
MCRTPNTYEVTFDNHGAIGRDLTASQNVTYAGKYGALPVPFRTDCTFRGWYTEADGQGTKVDANTIVTTASAHTLHAYWIDDTAPDEPVWQDNVTLPTDWTKAQDKISGAFLYTCLKNSRSRLIPETSDPSANPPSIPYRQRADSPSCR